jgi:hypothetical protein
MFKNNPPCITPGFEAAPYTAKPSGGRNDWWYVENASGFNCLSFRDLETGQLTGAKFTSQNCAKKLEQEWNDGRKQ